ncbi:MAG TPA: DUF4923 family protein [Puia sp.]|nr:DUF4923 family protein [Puia sp.]
MKKIAHAFIILFLLCSSKSFCQTIDVQEDSLKNLLCKKWQMDYAMMGGMKINKMPSAAEANFEFKKDGTFIETTNKDSKKINGTWIYDKNKKHIKLTINGKSSLSIISLKEDELTMLADTKQATPDDPMQLQIVYKISSN